MRKTPQWTKKPEFFCNEKNGRSTKIILQPASVSINKSSHVAWAGSEKARVSLARASTPQRSVPQSKLLFTFSGDDQTHNTNKQE